MIEDDRNGKVASHVAAVKGGSADDPAELATPAVSLRPGCIHNTRRVCGALHQERDGTQNSAARKKRGEAEREGEGKRK